MSDYKEKDGGENGTGVNRSPVKQPYYRQTLGLRPLPQKTPEEIAQEKELAEKASRESSLALLELRGKVAAREKRESEEKKTKPKDTEGQKQKLLQKLYKLGNCIMSQECLDYPKQINWENIRPYLGKLDSIEAELLWRAYNKLLPREKFIISYEYSLGMGAQLSSRRPKYSGKELTKAVWSFNQLVTAIYVFMVYEAARQKKDRSNKTEPELWLEALPLFSGKQVRFWDFAVSDCNSSEVKTQKAGGCGHSLFSQLDWEATGLPLFEGLTGAQAPSITTNDPIMELWQETMPLFSGKPTTGNLARLQLFTATIPDCIRKSSYRPATIEYPLFLKLCWIEIALPLFENQAKAAKKIRQLVVFEGKKTLTIDSELAEAIRLKWDGKDPKDNGIDPKIAEVVAGLKKAKIRLLAKLGIEKQKLGAVAKYLDMTPAVFISELEELTNKINRLYLQA